MSKLRIHFENVPYSTKAFPYFGGDIYSPEKDTDGYYTLIGVWGGTSTVIREVRYQDGYWYHTGYVEFNVDIDYTAYPYVLFAPNLAQDANAKKYLAVPMKYIRAGVDGIYDIQPAISDWEIRKEETTNAD